MGRSRKCVCAFIVAAFMLSSCSTPYKPSSGYSIASWYGAEFHGRPTASGEIYDMNAYTCAHKEYPFGTRLKVTSTVNDKSVNCIVNDRGPFVDGRDLDLSYAAAKDMGLLGSGTGTVRIDKLDRDSSYIKEVKYVSDSGPFTIQVGSFRDESNATRLKTGLDLKYSKVYISKTDINGEKFFRVRIGEFQESGEVKKVAAGLAEEGYSVFVTRYDEKKAPPAKKEKAEMRNLENVRP
jgi:rare lipoprotein A